MAHEEHGPHGDGAYSEVFEEGKDLAQAQTIHRIRANSSIMQLKKILGECTNRSWTNCLSIGWLR